MSARFVDAATWHSAVFRIDIGRELGPTTLLVMLAIHDRMTDAGECQTTREELAEASGLCVRSVAKAWRALQDADMIHLVSRGRGVWTPDSVIRATLPVGDVYRKAG